MSKDMAPASTNERESYLLRRPSALCRTHQEDALLSGRYTLLPADVDGAAAAVAGEIIAAKLESLRHCVQRLEDKRSDSAALLKADYDLQDIISLNLTRAVQLWVDISAYIIANSNADIPTTMGESFEALHALNILTPELVTRMKRAVGFRNIAVHNYQQIDWEIVYAICHQHRGDSKAFARAVVAAPGLA